MEEHAPQSAYEAPPLELFFDLAFVFAVSQLSEHLLSHLSWRGSAETLVMLVSVFAVWSYTSWAATISGANRARTRWMLLAVMLLGLFMHASVTTSFGARGWAFVVPFLTIQLGRTLWTFRITHDLVLRKHHFWVLVWLLATSPLWIAGAATNPEARLVWWGVAAGVDVLGSWIGHPSPRWRLRSENVGFAGAHMAERCVLFTIIALGETVITAGTAIVAVGLSPMTVLTGTAALVATVSLWALVFGHTSRLIYQNFDQTNDPYHASRHAVDALALMVAGLIGLAVAGEVVIAHPFGSTTVLVSVLLFGGPAVYVLAHSWYLWHVLGIWPISRVAGSVSLLLAGLVALAMPLYGALTLVGAILSLLAIIDWRYSREHDRRTT